MPVIVQYLLAGVVLLGFVGTSVVFLRGSKDKGTIETLERNNKALTGRVEFLEAEDERKTNQIKALVLANEVLTATANSSAEIADLRTAILAAIAASHDQLEAHHSAAMAGMDQIHTDLTDLTSAVTTALGGAS